MEGEGQRGVKDSARVSVLAGWAGGGGSPLHRSSQGSVEGAFPGPT